MARLCVSASQAQRAGTDRKQTVLAQRRRGREDIRLLTPRYWLAALVLHIEAEGVEPAGAFSCLKTPKAEGILRRLFRR